MSSERVADPKPGILNRVADKLGPVLTIALAVSAVLGIPAVVWGLINLFPPRCTVLADVNWGGWSCGKPVVMIGGCDTNNTRSLDWLRDQLRALSNEGSIQLPFQPFKLVPSRPDVDGHMASLYFCQSKDSDDECRQRPVTHRQPQALSVGYDDHHSVKFVNGNDAVYLDKDGETWCKKVESNKWVPIHL